MYICMYIYIYAHIRHIYINKQIHMYVYIYIYIYICMPVDKHANGPDENKISDLTRGDVTPHSRPLLLQITTTTVFTHEM